MKSNHGVLPANVVVGIIKAANQLASEQPPYYKLSLEEAMAVGKAIGKHIREQIFIMHKGNQEIVEISERIVNYVESNVPNVKAFDNVKLKELISKLENTTPYIRGSKKAQATGLTDMVQQTVFPEHELLKLYPTIDFCGENK